MRLTKNYLLLKRPLFVVLAVVSTSFPARAADEAAFFESKIRPLLVERCYECHSTVKKQKGGLVLDSKAGWEKGGDSGTAILPGKPKESLLIKAVHWTDKELRMPPEKAGGKLTDAEIADLEAWVRSGAFDPRSGAAATPAKKSWDEVFAERRQWWSLQPLRVVKPPVVNGAEWSAGTVDRFVRDRMTKAGVKPSPRADAPTLIRRATLVLTGLPPTRAEVDAFTKAAKQNFPKAYAALVDRLLASPQFGERFARHWLDVVRFTETHGNEWNYDVAYAWRYYSYFDTAVNRYLIERGGLDIHNGPIVGIVPESFCRFHRSFSYPETVQAGLRVGRLGRSSVRYEIGLFGQNEDVARADGHFVHVFVERALQPPTPIPAAIRAALEAIVGGP